MTIRDYELLVWARAIKEAEADVMRHTAVLTGGRLEGESIHAYVARATKAQTIALERLDFAKKKFDEIYGEK